MGEMGLHGTRSIGLASTPVLLPLPRRGRAQQPPMERTVDVWVLALPTIGSLTNYFHDEPTPFLPKNRSRLDAESLAGCI